MRLIHNATHITLGGLSRDDLLRLYAYPQTSRPWLRINFVTSIDGAVEVDGTSGGLGTPADKTVFGVLRELADAIVVGGGTVRAENYGAAQFDAAARERRAAAGLAPTAPIVVVSARANLDPQARLFTDAATAPILITSESADPERVRALADAGADVIVAGNQSVPSADLLDTLGARGYRRILCEGGPGLVGQLATDDVVDEACITTSPLLVGGSASRFAAAGRAVKIALSPAHVVLDDDGTILTRWVRVARE